MNEELIGQLNDKTPAKIIKPSYSLNRNSNVTGKSEFNPMQFLRFLGENRQRERNNDLKYVGASSQIMHDSFNEEYTKRER